MTTTRIPQDLDRNTAIAIIKQALKDRTGRTWSVTGGRGTAWGWITVLPTPKHRDQYGAMNDADRALLSDLFDEDVHHQGVSIPSSSAFRREYCERVLGLPVTKPATW